MKPRLKVKKKFIIFLIIFYSPFPFLFSVAWNPVFYIVLPHFYEFFACSIQVSDAHNRTVQAMPVGGIFLSCSPCSYHSCNFHPDSTSFPVRIILSILICNYSSHRAISLQMGFPIEENFSSYSVMTFPTIISSW